jgi:hypothetical protein
MIMDKNMMLFLKEYFRAFIKGNIPDLSCFRYYKRWNYLKGRDSLTVQYPWITFKAIDFISRNIRETDKVFEFGGGGSTLYFLSKVSELVTVEHDPAWFNMLKNKVNPADYSRWNGQLVLPEKSGSTKNLEKSRTADYYSGDPLFNSATFKSYSTFICRYEDDYFNWILVDGRARTSCLFHAIPKVKKGGFLVVDNSERKYYLKNNLANLKKYYRPVINYPGPVPYSVYFSKTTIWQRIK